MLRKFRLMIYGWCYMKSFDEWHYNFLYWKNMASESVTKVVLVLKRMFYSCGFIHKWKAFHWKRFKSPKLFMF